MSLIKIIIGHVVIIIFMVSKVNCQDSLSIPVSISEITKQNLMSKDFMIGSNMLEMNYGFESYDRIEGFHFELEDPATKYGFKGLNMWDIHRLTKKGYSQKVTEYFPRNEGLSLDLNTYIKLRRENQLKYDLGVFGEILGYSKDIGVIILAIIHILKYGMK